jgi:tRNA threonylcarbamoyladenosine biosynthesis protein TsaB
MKEAGYDLRDLDAIAVSNGPGSYTGLRVGLATAKGICFALHIPLIILNTLEVMTVAVLNSGLTDTPTNFLLCPLIDARRMEVFTALYDKNLNELLPQHAKIIDEKSFEKELAAGQVLFFGNGAEKCRSIITHPNAVFITAEHNAAAMIPLAEKKLQAKEFADPAYAEPFYIKEFHMVPSKK